MLSKQQTNKNQIIIYKSILLSSFILLVKRIIGLVFYTSLDSRIVYMNSVATISALIIIIIGLFLQMNTTIKRKEELKLELKTFYEATENNIKSYVIIFDENYKVVYMNKKAKECIKDLDDNFIACKKQHIESYFTTSVRDVVNKKGYYNDRVKYFINGYYDIFIQKVNTETGIKRYVAIFTDVTEEYNYQKQLKLKEERLKSITENIVDAIVSLDKRGKVDYVNEAALNILDMKYEEVIGKKYNEIVGDIHFNATNLMNNSAILSHTLVNNSGKKVELESIIRRLTNENGDIENYIIVSRNTELRKSYENLSAKYNEIKEYDKIKTEFFANLSHEFRTPINIIISSIQLLNAKRLDGNEELLNYYDKYEKTIKQNCLRILRLVNNVIDITKYESGFLKMNFTNCDIVSVVEGVCMSLIPYVEEKLMKITFDTNIEEQVICFDIEQIERVMLNIISNAVKYSEKGGEIFVSIEADETWINLRVKDTGCGIPVHLKELIFERFIQTDKSLNRRKEGSGIGLAIVKSIVSSHEGEVLIEDTSSKGTTFLMKLPNKIDKNSKFTTREMDESNNNITEMIGLEFSDIYEI